MPQPQAFPAEGQIGDLVVAPGGLPRRRKDLETAVKQNRMQADAAAVNGFRQGDLANRLAIRRPERLKRAERWAQVDADVCPCAVEGRDILRNHARLQSVHSETIGGPARPDAQRRCALCVQRPALFGRALAEYLNMLRVPVLGRAQHGLDFSSALLGVVLVLLRKDHRAVQLQVLHIHRLRAFGQRRRCRHSAIQRARHYHPPEGAMVVQPGRVGREHFCLEHHLAAWRLVPGAQQRMPGGHAPAPWRFDPVSFTLEGVARQSNPAPLLSREQSLEGKRQPCLVCARNGGHEVLVVC